MSKKVLVISTSPRKGGNSDLLADEFVRGAREAGNSVEKITLYDKTIGFCKGCLACQRTQRCVIHDLSLIHISDQTGGAPFQGGPLGTVGPSVAGNLCAYRPPAGSAAL